MPDRATALHESGHAAAAILLDREIVDVRVDRPGVDDALGWMRHWVRKGDSATGCLAISLAGYLAEGRPDWPPPYADALDEPLEGLGEQVRELGLDEAGYARVVAIVEEMVRDREFRRIVAVVSRALHHVPVLTESDLDSLVSIGAANGS